ncbi:MAG: C40 family peptidase [Candidatus Eremiobacteraeota bacterium]|nr:C40 family peptidase [Candidatus Eremiobacteraeota bacterium]MBC5826813.1 C40 family peptidase [Candidatus Eremiobacteraeota bacterium]
MATAFCLLTSTGAPSLASSARYTVARGDTLISIARHHGVTLKILETMNGLSPSSVLRIGEQLSVKDGRAYRIPHSARPLQYAINRALWQATHVAANALALPARRVRIVHRVAALDISITKTALRYIGVPYAWGGTSLAGVDCSGFVQTVFYQHGIFLPRTADAQFSVGTRVASSSLRSGDLVFFETYTAGASHVGIYLGQGRFVHASSSSGVRVDRLSEGYYASRFIGGRRLIN